MRPLSDHIRRSGDDYAGALANLLPQGIAWPRNPTSTLMKVVSGLSQIWGYVDKRAADLLENESDPRITFELLEEWERAFGLPDECATQPQTIALRHTLLIQRMTMLGHQDRAFFIAMAAQFGYNITIREYSPFMCGISQCGDTLNLNLEDQHRYRWEIGRPEIRFVWTVTTVDESSADLECILNRFRPAHTYIAFSYYMSSPERDPPAKTLTLTGVAPVLSYVIHSPRLNPVGSLHLTGNPPIAAINLSENLLLMPPSNSLNIGTGVFGISAMFGINPFPAGATLHLTPNTPLT